MGVNEGKMGGWAKKKVIKKSRGNGVKKLELTAKNM